MIGTHVYPTATAAWEKIIQQLVVTVNGVAPRGEPTREILHASVGFPMFHPVVTRINRRLNYKFMVAEALWILSGRDDVGYLAKHSSNMLQFSDDGVTLSGAYGPRVASQFSYVVEKLREDESTRQAVLTTWERNPAPSKDIPCTIAITFNIRYSYLNAHVFMRSSDAWLGVPYDFFSFSCIAMGILAALNDGRESGNRIYPGVIYWTAASSHLYDRDIAKAESCLGIGNGNYETEAIPRAFTNNMQGFKALCDELDRIQTCAVVDRPPWIPKTFVTSASIVK